MNNLKFDLPADSDRHLNRGVGAAIGLILGALIGDLIADSSIVVIPAMLFGALVGYLWFPRIHLMEYPPKAIRLMAFSGVLFLVTLASSFYFIDINLDDPVNYLIAFAPAIPAFIFVFSLGYAISTLDEMQRRIQVEAIAIGFGITAIIALSYGLLGLAGLLQLNWVFVTVVMMFSWLVGKIWTRLKYQ